VYIYHVAPARFGIAVREEFDYKEVFPTMSKMLMPVPDITADALLEGDFSY
jgi:hypothetical protein